MSAEDDEFGALSLFENHVISVADIEQPLDAEETTRSRGLEFYLYAPSESSLSHFSAAAVSGDVILEKAKELDELRKAKFELEFRDINSLLPKKRRCRPGKNARARKIISKEIEKKRLASEKRFNRNTFFRRR